MRQSAEAEADPPRRVLGGERQAGGLLLPARRSGSRSSRTAGSRRATATLTSYVLEQGRARLRPHHAARRRTIRRPTTSALHGDGVRDIAFQVDDADRAFEEAVRAGRRAGHRAARRDRRARHASAARRSTPTATRCTRSSRYDDYNGPFLPGLRRARRAGRATRASCASTTSSATSSWGRWTTGPTGTAASSASSATSASTTRTSTPSTRR